MSAGSNYPSGAALVIGGSGGLGAACARQMGCDGNNVAVTYHQNQQAAEQLNETIKNVQTSCHQMDVADAGKVDDVIGQVIARHGRINSLVYAVGSNIAQPLVSEISQQQWLDVVNHDLNGFVRVVQPVIQHMREHGGGSLVHVSSAGLGRTPPRDALSVAPKAAIDALMQTIATEEGQHGIRANSVGVGVIEAGIFKRLEAAGVFDDQWKQAVKASLPLGRFGQAQDIAEAVAFFCLKPGRVYYRPDLVCRWRLQRLIKAGEL